MIHLFSKDAINNIVVFAASSGTPVTGLVDTDFTVHEVTNGAAPATVVVTGLVTELDAVNTPGLYNIAIPSGIFATASSILFYISSAHFDTEIIRGNIGLLDFTKDIRAMAGQVGTSITVPVYDGAGNMTGGTLNGFNPGDDPSIATPRVSATITATYNADGTMASFKVTEV